jgi:hypothetical protein
MPWDWVGVTIVTFIFLGFATTVMGLAFESVESGVPAATEEENWDTWVTVLEDMSRKAALTERAMKQLAIIKESAEIVLYNYHQRIDLSK